MSGPSSTYTFFFTDIEGSTVLWETYPDAMKIALAKHDLLMRHAIEGNNGTVFKTIGDAFCAVFTSALDGLKASLEAQLNLIKEDWPTDVQIKVRMALHVGAVESRDNDYFGQTVNRVARLLAVAHGGQTVLSQTAVGLVCDNLPSGVSLLDLGEHRLKDLARPENIFQVVHPELPSSFAPLRSLDSASLPNNLPEQLTSFVGRQNELGRVTELLAKSRLVTLTGSGGCGKTRLAIQAAAENADNFNDGVWLTELAPLTDQLQVSQSIAGLLGVREEPGQTISQTLVSQLRNKKLLILLDNCEHLLMGCAQLAESLLRTCPDVRILATSREALNISGEATYRVPSLSQPDPKKHKTPESLEEFESVKLFVDRAKSVAPHFQVTEENAGMLARLCQQLDGIPLAIELAAARVRSLSVEQIAERLNDRFRLLTGGSRTALPRQQTLRALVDWSYDLLGEAERALLRRLSVFSGGWTLIAAEEITAGGLVEDWEVLDHMTSLLDKSLVSFDSIKGVERYRMLETVKRYGREKLQESGEEDKTLGDHMTWFVTMVAEAGIWERGPKQIEQLDRLELELDNLWLALETCQNRGDREATAQLAFTLGVMLQYRGFLNDAITAIDAGIKAYSDCDGDAPPSLAKLIYERAGLHQDLGETTLAARLANQALAYFQRDNDVAGIARAENLIGQIAMGELDFEVAESRFDSSLDHFREVNDQIGVSIVRNNQGVLARRKPTQSVDEHAENLQKAYEFLEEALKIRRSCQDLMGEAETLNNLGVVAFERGDFHEARRHYLEALGIERQLKRTPGIGTTLANLGEVAGVMGDRDRALMFMAVSERILQDIQSPLAGAVRSMMLDLAEGMATIELNAISTAARTTSVDVSIDQIVTFEAVQV